MCDTEQTGTKRNYYRETCYNPNAKTFTNFPYLNVDVKVETIFIFFGLLSLMLQPLRTAEWSPVTQNSATGDTKNTRVT